MRMIKLALCLGVAAGVMMMASQQASAGDATGRGNTDAKKTSETIRHEFEKQKMAKGAVIGGGATPGDVKTSTDDSGAQPAEAPHDKVGTVPGESTPGDVKTSNDDSGHNNDAAPNDKVGTVPGESTPGDVKTSTDDNGAQPDKAPHDKAAGH